MIRHRRHTCEVHARRTLRRGAILDAPLPGPSTPGPMASKKASSAASTTTQTVGRAGGGRHHAQCQHAKAGQAEAETARKAACGLERVRVRQVQSAVPPAHLPARRSPRLPPLPWTMSIEMMSNPAPASEQRAHVSCASNTARARYVPRSSEATCLTRGRRRPSRSGDRWQDGRHAGVCTGIAHASCGRAGGVCYRQ